ncbi:MAG: pitrilysin family protein [bacterium]|nr:pitrilysin family protein [bacterium]
MKYRIFITAATLILAAMILTVTVSAQDVSKLKYPDLNKLEIPEVEKITLDNGIRLYLLEDKSLPVFRVSSRINCGDHLEPLDKVGLASICGTVMRTGGTSKWTGDEIDEMLEAIGGSVETSISTLSANARVNVLSDQAELGLEVLSQILRTPVFDEDKIELAKVQERSVISRRNDDPQGIAFREYVKLIYGSESPYARHPEYATINAVERQDLIDFHGSYFKPQNVQMAIWGDFDREELLKLMNTYFGDWKMEGDPVPAPPTVDYKFESGVYYINKPDVNQSNIVLGHVGGLTTDPDYAERIVMNNILGGGFGSRLFNQVRSKEGLAYAVFGVYTSNISYPGVFYNFVSTKSETSVKAIREIIKQIKSMQVDIPTEDEMRIGKDGYLNSFVFNFDTKAEVVNRLMNYDFYGLPDDFLSQEKERVEQVTPEGVLEASKKNLRPDALKILVVGKGEDFEMPLDQAGLGAVTSIDIAIPSGEEKKELAVTEENLAKGAEILGNGITAAGGLDNFKKISSISMKGTLTLTMPQGEIPLQIEEQKVLPDKTRTVINAFGQTMYDISDGTTGWKTNQMTGEVVAKTEEELVEASKEERRNLIKLFQNSDSPDFKAVFAGVGTEGGISVNQVAIIDEAGETICTISFNAQTSELISMSYWGETPMGEGSLVQVYGNFTETAGVKIPLSLTTNMDGKKVMNLSISQYDINAEIPATAFEKP